MFEALLAACWLGFSLLDLCKVLARVIHSRLLLADAGGLLAPIQEIFGRIGVIPASGRYFGFLACTGVAGLCAQMENIL